MIRVLWGFLLVAIGTGGATADDPVPSWHVGCFHGNVTSEKVVGGASVAPVECGAFCLQKGSRYIAVSPKNECACLSDLPNQHLSAPTNACYVWCRPDGVRLRCGGSGMYSVYLSAGPYLLNVSARVLDHPVYVHQPMALELLVQYAGPPNMSFGVAGDSQDGSLQQVDLSVNYGEEQTQQTLTATGTTLHDDDVYTYNKPGSHVIEVLAANQVSAVRTRLNVTVQFPVPAQLQLAVMTSDVPSCVPSGAAPRRGLRTQAVFARESASFQASVDAGYNLTFDWSFGDDVEAVSDVPSTRGCRETDDCLTSSMNYTFTTEGLYNISVTASNEHGTVSDMLQLIVVRRELSHLTLDLDPGHKHVATLSDSIRFQVSMVTTDRQDTHLEVDFGDGVTPSYLIVDQHGRYLGLLQGASNQVALQADYGGDGEGCLLKLAIDHIYDKQGVFNVTVRARNNNNDVSASLNQSLVIQQKLQGMQVQGRRQGALVGVSYTYVVEFGPTMPRGVTYTWEVRAPDDSVFQSEQTSSNQLDISFTARGTYAVTLQAENLINSDQVRFGVSVHEPIRDLSIRVLASSGSHHLVATGETVSFQASVASNSGVEFEWDFQDTMDGDDDLDDDTNIGAVDNQTSEAKHTFLRSGSYRVEVTAFNDNDNKTISLSEAIVVQDPIEGLNVTSNGATLYGKPTLVTASVTSGSDVIYVLEYNGTRLRQNGSLEVTWSVTLELGETELRVMATNGVSEQEQTTFVEVQKGVDKVSVITKVNLVLGEKAVFIALQESVAVDRTDLLYTWTVEDQVVAHTKAPVLEMVFTGTNRKISVKVKVQNKVDSKEKGQIFQLFRTQPDMRLTQGGIKEFGSPISFTLINLHRDCVKILVYYRHNGQSDDDTIKLNSNHSGVAGWSHNFSTPGVYEVEVTPTGVDDSSSALGVLAVQQRLADISLVGPSAVPLMSNAYSWQVNVGSGSHLLYDWSIDGVHLNITPDNQLRHRFTKAGKYVISVNVSNSLDWREVHQEVVAELPLHRLRLSTRPVLSGRPTDILIHVLGGPPRHFHIDLGDGTIYDGALEDLPLKLHLASSVDNGRKYALRHTYEHVGTYDVKVNVSNSVTSFGVRKEVRVEEPTTGVRLNTIHGPIVALGTHVVVVATVETGKNLTFDWDVTGSIRKDSVSDGVSSSVTLELDQVGTFNVTVHVTNSLDSSSYVTASLPYVFSVFEPITDLSLTEQNGRDWAKLEPAVSGGVEAAVIFYAIAGRGSSVTCHFDLGDGTSRTIPGSDDGGDGVTCEVSHLYTKADIYTVRVIAANPLGNTTAMLKPFYVQVPPSGCRLLHDARFGAPGRFTVPFGDDFVVNVTYSSGTGVMVDWDMGDLTEHKNKSGTIRHHYIQPGEFRLVVKCYNKAGSETQEKQVSVIRPILGAQVVVEGGLRHSNAEFCFFHVKLSPEQLTGSHIVYSWEFGEQNVRPLEGGNRMSHIYTFYGRYSVHVEAFNAVSRVRSPPVLVEIIEPLESIELVMTGEPLLGRELLFEAYHYKGSNVTYTWNFSDGEPIVGYYQKIRYVYQQTGEYVVSVVASNPFGNLSASRIVFVLQSPCSTPKVTLLEGAGQREPNVTRGQEVRLEADVKINCSITSAANYTWRLVDAATSRAVHLKDVPDKVFTDPILFIPRHTLSYGRYKVTLKVVMHGTIVYAEARTHFSVVPAQLKAVISGGLQRYAQRTETVLMDGSASYDPDYPKSPQLRYKWACYQLNKPELSCLKENVTVSWTGATLRLLGSVFSLNTSVFVFNLTISRADRGHDYTTSQVLEMKSHIIDMALSCSECDDGLINSDQRLIVEARHPGHTGDDLDYSWKLSIVADGSALAPDSYDPSHCVGADKSSYPLKSNSTATNTTTGGSTNQGSGVNRTLTSTTTSGTPGGATTSTKSSTTTTTAQSALGPVPDLKPPEQPPGGAPGPPAFLAFENPSQQGGPISEGYSGRRHDSSGSGRAGGEPVPTPASAGSAADGVQPSDSPTEAQGSRRGSGSGYPQGPGQDPAALPPPGGRGQNDAGRGTLGGNAGDVVDNAGGDASRSVPHIVSLRRSQIRIRPETTTTGVHQGALVFNPGVLLQGRTYIIEGEVTHKVTGRKGTALTYVKVNPSPSEGQCSLSSYTGTEMDTLFTVICSDWKDAHLPIQYEISYSLDDGTSRDLIYQGLNHQTSFMLPAGNAARNHTVLVNIAILDSFGARTTVCSLPVKVEVQNRTSLSQEEEDLYQMVAKEDSTLQTYVSKGDNRNARLHAHLVAHRLNRLHGNGNDVETTLRAKIRTSMLQTLKDLPMRDEYEVQQTTSAVAASTAVSAELESKSLEYASEILAKATEQMTRLSDVSKHVDSDIISVAIQGSSNIVAAASQVTAKGGENEAATKPVVERTRWSIHNLTQTELSYTVLGEEPKRRETEALLTYAGRFRISDIANTKSTAPNFVLPTSLSTIIEKEGRHGNQTQDCYEMHIVTYKRNPFLYGKGRLKAVDSQVASLTLFSCSGGQVVVDNLPLNDQISMVIPHVPRQSKKEMETFELHKHQMQVHELKVNLNPTDLSSLHIVIQLQPVPQGRLFPIALLLRPDEAPTPDKYQYKKVFPASAEKLNLFLPALALNESTTYYLGVVDAHFNGARPRPGEVQLRQYTLQMLKSECVFWDEQLDDWSNKGCTIQETSTLLETECRCKHLTAFGANNSLVPNDLNFSLNVDDFFDLNENPVTFTLVIALLGLYIVLLVFCVMSDNHDKKKGAIVHLVDNSPNHVHTYVITMETGMRRGAGTSAKVSLVLHGKEGMSETRELVSESGQPLFERNSRDTFIITLPENMGQIWKVQLWHNNVGDSPNWYLSRVIVKDVNNGQTFFFSCEKWFAVEEEDGKVEREIMALDTGLGFAKVLWAKGTQYLTDYHLWFSMLVRPSYSRFTRAQRLTCCLALLTSYMAVNAAWYRESDPEYRGEFGLIDLSWRAVAVGGITSLIVLPVNFLLVFVFRRSKIKKVCIEDPPEKKYYPVKRDSVISLDSTVRLLQPAVTPSIFDQSMINWATLQDWAQRQWAKRYQQQLAGQVDDGTKPEGQGKREHEPDQTSAVFDDCLIQDPNTDLTSEPTNQQLPDHQAPPPADSDTNRQAEELEERHRQVLDRELRRQHELDKYVLESIRSNKARRLFLPSGCRYVAWLFAFIIIAGCSAITVLYGFRFGKTKSILWMQSLFFSFIQCVFISHPLVVLVISVYTAIRYRNDLSIFDHHDDGVIEQRTNALLKSRQPRRDGDEDLAMGIAQRQRSRYLHYARPPQEKQLIEARKKIMKEKKATSVLSESVSVIILIVLLFFVAYSKDISTPFRLNSVLKDLLTKSGSEPFHAIKSVEAWHRWSHSDMLDTLYWEKWYNGQHTNHDKGYVGNSAILGTISLRQLRVKADRCHAADTYGLVMVCYHDYGYGNHDTKPYGVNGTWRFYESNITRATGLTGKYAHYDGSGYQIILPKTRLYTYDVLSGLEKGGWIDRNTRAVIVEFTLYSAPTKLFSSVTLLLEQSPGGGVSTSARVSSAHLFRYTSGFDNFVLACELLLVVVTLYKLHCEVGDLAWYQKAYFKNPWKTIEATVLLLLLSYIACYIFRFVIVYEAVELMRATYHEEFVDVSYIAYWDEILRSLLGFIILLVIVQSLRLFRNRKMFAKFGGVYRKAGIELLYLALMLVIWVCAYTSLGYALYGSLSYNFGRWDTALTTVLGLLTGRNGLTDVDLLERTGSQLFLVSFLIFAVGSLTAYIVAVLTFHYRIYRDEGLPSLTTPELITYFWTKLLQLTGFAPSNASSEGEEDPTMVPAEFRMAAIESQVDEMLFKMNALTGGSGLPEKPPVYFTDSDGTYASYGVGDDGLSSGGSEVRTFDEDRFDHRVHKIEDNLIANEPHLAQLLQLDAMGVNVLSQERENQLRSALELQIFWQLQVQRRNSADVRSLPSDNGQVVIHRLSSLSGSASSSGGASSNRGSPITMATIRRSREHLCRTRTEMDVLSMRSGRSVRSKASRDTVPHPSSRGSLQSVSRADALVLQELSRTPTPHQHDDDAIPLQQLVPIHRPLGGTREAGGAVGGASRAETRLLEDPVSTSSCSSGGAEVRYIVSGRGQHSPTTTATVSCSSSSPSSPSSSCAAASSPTDSSSIKSVTKSKSKATSGSASLPDAKSGVGGGGGGLPGYEFLYTDTSSGSEQEGALRASPSKARSLRKTRSRGKGKGRNRLVPVEGGTDELGLENQAYTSGSDHEAADGPSKTTRHKV